MHRRENYRWPGVDHVAGVVEVLGNGSFGCAYLLPDGRVLKVGEGIDATCVWINEAAKHFAMHGEPGRCMPVVWEFDTELYQEPEKQRVMVQPGGWTRMPDGGLMPLEAVYEEREHITHKAWWYAVMEKVEAHVSLRYSDQEYIEEWGRVRGIRNTDVFAKNCGRASDGRMVCFDPFYYQPPEETLRNMRTIRTGYTGPKAYKATASEVYDRERDTGRAKPRAMGAFLRGFDEMVALKGMRDLAWQGGAFNRMVGQQLNMQVVKKRDVGQLGRININAELTFGGIERRIQALAASNREKRREPYVAEGMPPKMGFRDLMHGPVGHGRRWG